MKQILFICCFVCLSCSNSIKIKKELNLINSKSIVIPQYLTVTYNGKDTLKSTFDCNNKYKFVVYYDSTECNTCNMHKIKDWESILIKFKEHIYFLFIFQPSNNGIKKLKTSLKSYPINYPIFIDEQNDFEKLNPHLPKNKAMHTFLLDENNKVILVGNPLYNKEIEKLFYKITQEKLSK